MSRIDDILQIQLYRLSSSSGKVWFDRWLESLDLSVRARVAARLRNLATGHFGDCKRLAKNLWELRLQFGSGYRIYFAKVDPNKIALIGGGDKATQTADVRKAKILWQKYLQKEAELLKN